MIKKLMKYDIKKMTKILVYFYVISILLSIITRLINIGKNIQIIAIIGQVFAGLTYSAVASILINTFIHIIKVFACDFYKDESYLIHTLPVTKNQLLISKYLSGLVVVISSVIVSFLSIFIVLYSKEFFETLKVLIEKSITEFNIPVWLFILIMVVLIFAQICAIISMAFTSVVKANTYNSKRSIKSLMWFAIYYFGSMLVTLLIAVIIFAIGGNLSELGASVLSQSSFLTLLILALVCYIIYAFVYYFICKNLFNKGVNVD